MAKFVFVTGGVVSSVGKGIVTASLGRILKARGFTVSVLKLDPYINVDPGTMSPYQHGEVFVTDDGAETDLDLGHYERFIDTDLTKMNSSSSGQIYEEVIRKERRGDYLGGTIQAVPHVTNEIKRRIRAAGTQLKADIVIVEVGGTVGDIEGQVFLEAISQMRAANPAEALSIHVTLLPYIGSTHELKTKPTQHSVRELRAFGIQPDVIITRSDFPVPDALREKVALFCSVQKEAVIPLQTARSIYEVPLILEASGLGDIVTRKFEFATGRPDLEEWAQFVERLTAPKKRATIAIVGKYIELHDAYLSIKEALVHAGVHHNTELDFRWVHSEQIEASDAAAQIGPDVDGILLCPGFGDRGLEGKIAAVRHARENHIPYLGDCLGLQMLVVEFARNVAKMPDANTTEADPKTPFPVISLLSEQQEVHDMGGTMRLGGYDCRLTPGTKAHAAYGADTARERHRHRYEVNNSLLPQLEQAGLIVAGRDADSNLVEIVEIPDHPFMVGAQFHPEFTSRPNRPNPLFRDFVGAAVQHAQGRGRADRIGEPNDTSSVESGTATTRA